MEYLDNNAGFVFGTEIFTPADVDLKERNPHQFLGKINIGYSRTKPELIRIVSHEGAFGHNTQQILSKQSSFQNQVLHLL